MPALRRLREDAGESPPEFGQEIILFSKVLTRRNIYIESGSVFPRGGKEAPPKGDSDSPIEDKFEREADLASSEAERAKSDEGLGDLRRNCLWDYSPKTHRELRRAGELEERLDRKVRQGERLRRGPNNKRRVSAPGTALGHQGGAAGLGTGLGMDCAAQERFAAYTRGQTAKSILRAWAGVINSHMRTPALRRLWEDAGESPPECGQEIILFSKGLTRRNLYIESGTVLF